MISKLTAAAIWTAYDEIARGEALLEELEKRQAAGDGANLRDAFGRCRGLQLGVPSGESGHRLLDLQPSLAVQVIRAHIAQKRAELGVLNERARAELVTPLD